MSEKQTVDIPMLRRKARRGLFSKNGILKEQFTGISDAIDFVIDLIPTCTPKRESGWVRVEDKLPPYATRVMAWWRPIDDNPWAEAFVIAERCYVERPHVDEGQGAYEPGCWFANGRYYPAFHITHWMHLPEIPVESKRAEVEALSKAEDEI